ncbi:MAG TPA: hypothetical protein VKU79_05880 [Thermoplasmataceae archaeon]|nr:hypothetical protein [Thermoplasmataceae archaeon]
MMPAFVALIIISSTGIIFLTHSEFSRTSVSSHEAAFDLETTVTGMLSNAQAVNPIYIGSNYYTSSNITDFSATTTSSLQSTVEVSLSNVIPGEYVYFKIVVRNTGHVAVNLSTFSESFYYFNNTTGLPLPYTGTPSPLLNGTYEVATVNGYENPTLSDTFLTNLTFATDPSNTVNYGEDPSFGLDGFSQSYAYFNSSSYDYQWFQDNSANQTPIGGTVMTGADPLLEPGQTLTWYLFYGLGIDSPLNLPPAIDILTLNFLPAHQEL